MNKDIVWHEHAIDKAARAAQNGHKAFVLWFTGLSGSGKSTIAGALEQELFRRGVHTYLLDGDNVRHGLCKGLGFSLADRQENLRRVGEASKLMVDAGLVVLAAFVSPYRADRDAIRALLPDGEFVEVFVDTPLAECEQRDPKGLYKKARAGEIKNFTGIDDPYEAPETPEVIAHSDSETPEESLAKIIAKLEEMKLISSSKTDTANAK